MRTAIQDRALPQPRRNVVSRSDLSVIDAPDLGNDVELLHRRCGVYTRSVIVRRILDAVGWTASIDLSRARLLEPAAGAGAFVTEAARRLVASCRRRGAKISAATLSHRIFAFELHAGAAAEARANTKKTLIEHGVHHKTAEACVNAWIRNADFLLAGPPAQPFTHVVGNPPYVRWSKIPACLRQVYTSRLPSDVTGGDLFVPFLDRALEQLKADGRCGFVCSDRWRYMGFAESFRHKWLPALDVHCEDSLPAAEAFVSSVMSYPSVLVASKRRDRRFPRPSRRNHGRGTLMELGHVVRVGPALGHTPAFVLGRDEDDVEPELLHPWVSSAEIAEGSISWRGRRIIAMYDAKGLLLDLARFPLLAARLERFAEPLRRRSIVRKGAPWYRTIDRVRATDWSRPKLLVPELAKIPRLAIDRTGAIPSHGVYAIFAKDDNVDALYAKLRNGRLHDALKGSAPRISGGYIRCYKRFLTGVQVSRG